MSQPHRRAAPRAAVLSRCHGRLRRAAALVVLCTLALVLGAGQALAHTRLLGSDPAEGASVATVPERVSLRFNEAMQADFSTVTVTGPDGATWQSGPVTADGATVVVALRPLGPAGRYEIGYRVVSDDGHPVSGTVAFVLTTPGPAATAAAEPSAAAPPSVPAAAGGPAGGPPVWPWILAAVALVVGGVVVALRLGRR